MAMDHVQRVHKFLGCKPRIDPTAYIAQGAVVIGDVRIGPRASIWCNAVVRGDINYIEIGEGSNVQDGSVVHLADDYPAIIGNYVTIGHLAMIHACTIADECLIGMKSAVLDGAVIGRRSIIGAGAVVTQRTVVPPGSMVLGVPGKVVRALSEKEQEALRCWADKYVETAALYKEILKP